MARKPTPTTPNVTRHAPNDHLRWARFGERLIAEHTERLARIREKQAKFGRRTANKMGRTQK